MKQEGMRQGEKSSMALAPTKKLTVMQAQVHLADPHIWSDNKDRLSILASLYEPLICHDVQGNYCSALAQSWTVEEDACTWTFYLRTGVSFHNGDTLEAKDVIATLERTRDPVLGGELGTQGVYQSYLAGAIFTELDKQTVQIVTAEPMADLLDLLVEIPIVPRRALAYLPEKAVGSGPYRLVEAAPDLLRLEAFPSYWRGAPPVEQLVWRAEPDAQQRFTALLAGESDIAAGITPEGKCILEATKQATVVTAASSVCVIFICNLQSGVCADRRVRQALNYALDVPRMIEQIKEGAALPLNGPLTPLHFGYDPSTPVYTYDPDQARHLLIEAGYGKGLHMVIDVPTIIPNEAPQLAKFMAEQYASVGITTEIRAFPDRPAYANKVRVKEIADLCCFDSSPLSTYRVLSEKFHSRVQGPWWQGYANPAVDSLIDQARKTINQTRRQKLYRQAYRMIRDDAPWIFLYTPFACWGVGPQAAGWTVGVDNLIRLI